MAFIEHRLADDPTNWWAANRACVEALLRVAGLNTACFLPPETYLCEPDGNSRVQADRLAESEFLAATGQT